MTERCSNSEDGGCDEPAIGMFNGCPLCAKHLPKPGLTGQFPRGKLNKEDQGELALAISKYRGQVRVDFGTPTVWFALPPEAARAMAGTLVKWAEEIERDGKFNG